MRNFKSRFLAGLAAVGVALGLISPAANATPIPQPPSDTGPYTAASIQVDPIGGKAARGSIAFLPDTQFYSRYEIDGGNLYDYQYDGQVLNPFESQTRWIVDNTATYNIAMTQHLGDVVDRSGKDGEWELATRAMKRLSDAGVNFAIIPGNHDIDNYPWPNVEGDAWTRYITAFPVAEQQKSPSYKETGPNQGAASMHKFTVAGVEMMSVNVADYRDFAWANTVLQANSTVPAIVTMHQIVNLDGNNTAIDTEGGEKLWNEVINKNPNVFLTFNGHHHGATNRVKYINNDPDLPVIQHVLDYQMAYMGGNGQMNLLEFDFTNNQLSLTGFSPWVMEKPENKLSDLDIALLTGEGDTYTIPYDFGARFAKFGATFNPVGQEDSATIALRNHLRDNFTAPEPLDMTVSTGAHDYFDAPGTVAYWRPTLENGAISYPDISGNGNDMVAKGDQGAAEFVAESYQYAPTPAAVLFNPDAGQAYFETNDAAPINAMQFENGYTVEMFIQMTPGVPNQWMDAIWRATVESPETTLTDDMFIFGVSKLNEARYKSGGIKDIEGWSNWSGEIFKGQWYHLAAVNNVEEHSVELYINGNPILRNRFGDQHDGLGLGKMTEAKFLLGAIPGQDPWYGAIGEVRISEGALPRSQWLTARGVTTFEQPTITGTQVSVGSFDPAKVEVVIDDDNASTNPIYGEPNGVYTVNPHTQSEVTVTYTAVDGYNLGVDGAGNVILTQQVTLEVPKPLPAPEPAPKVLETKSLDTGTVFQVEVPGNYDDVNNVKLVVEDLKEADLADDINAALADAGFDAVQLYDISLINKDGKTVTVFPDGGMILRITAPEGFDNDTMKFVRIEDGKVVELDAKVEGGMVVVKVDHFSVYGFVKKAATHVPEKKPTKLPKTGC